MRGRLCVWAVVLLAQGSAEDVATFWITQSSPSATLHRDALSGKDAIFRAECGAECQLRITIGLSCPYDAPAPRFERVPFYLNEVAVQPLLTRHTWTASTSYGISFTLEDLPSVVQISEFQEFSDLHANFSDYTYSFTVLGVQFYEMPPDLATHVVLFETMQSIAKIGAGACHIFAASSAPYYNQIYFATISTSENVTIEDDVLIAAYAHSLDADGDETHLVDIFSFDGRTEISALLWSGPVATLCFGNATFDVLFSTHSSFGLSWTADGSNGLDMRYTDQLAYGYPTEQTPVGSYLQYLFSFDDDPLKYVYLTIKNLTRSSLSYSIGYVDADNVTQHVWLRFDDVPNQVYCSSRLISISTNWVASVPTSRLRARLEWHRHDNPLRKCTEIIPNPADTTPASTTHEYVPISKSPPSTIIFKIGEIVGGTLATILILILLIIFCLWRRKRLIEFEALVERQIREITAKRNVDQFLRRQAWVNLAADSEWEIDPTALFFGDEICKTDLHQIKKTTIFGALPCTIVYPALKILYPITPAGYEVAVKSAAIERAKINILIEVKALKSIPPHVHLLSLIGCTSDPSNPMIVTEYCQLGDLLTIVKKIHSSQGEPTVTYADFPLIAWQIADGLAFLSSLKIIHRDVAARNVLVTAEKMVKICDFAQSRQGEEYQYAKNSRQNRTPVRWCAPEAANEGNFSEKSDVWSFGVLLWEMHSLGRTPYEDIPLDDLPGYLYSGGTLVAPSETPNWMVRIMENCWLRKPKLRPSFAKLTARLRRHFQIVKHNEYYMNLSNGNELSIEATQSEDSGIAL